MPTPVSALIHAATMVTAGVYLLIRSSPLLEYSSIVLFSCITAIFFLGGYHLTELLGNNTFINMQSIFLGLKTCLFCFLFVLVRATLPRLRYDQLISFCWLNLLSVSVAFIILVLSILVAFDIAPY